MTNYIPNYDKKRKILVRREQHLRRLIERGVSGEKLIAAVEQVRESRISWLKSLRANPPLEYRRQPEKYSEAGAKIQALLEMPVETLLVEFGARAPRDDNAQ